MGLVGKKLNEEIRPRTAHGVGISTLAHPDNRLVLSRTRLAEVTYDV